MSTKWTVERLDALPEGTVIEWLVPGGKPLHYFIKDLGVTDPDRPWVYTKGGAESSLDILRMVALKESLRVVSVPIDALLADGAVDVAQREAWVSDSEGWSVRHGIRAAVAHITGSAE